MQVYETSTQVDLTLPSVTYKGCPDDEGNPQTYKYEKETKTFGDAPTTANYEPYLCSEERTPIVEGESFRKIKESGIIKMTPYSHSKVVTRNHLYTSIHGACSWRWTGFHSTNSKTGCESTYFERQKVVGQYSKVYDYNRLTAIYSVPHITTSAIDFEDVYKQADNLKSSVMADALTGYDLLTELGEAKETLTFLKGKLEGGASMLTNFATKDERSWKRGLHMTPKQLLSNADKQLQKLGGRWMEFRYAIMPLVYSFKDVKELIGDDGGQYKTNRGFRSVSAKPTGNILPDSGYFIEVRTDGKVDIRVTTKAFYQMTGLKNKLAKGIAMNPFATAWELIPLSFVVDWFINIGNQIRNYTSIDYSTNRASCVAFKSDYTMSYIYHDVDLQTVELPGQEWYGVYIPPETVVIKNPQSALLREIEYNTYNRQPFSRDDTKIVIAPYLNWKRTIDGIVLSYYQTHNILKSLKRKPK